MGWKGPERPSSSQLGPLPPAQGAPSPVQPGLEPCQGEGSHSFSGQLGQGLTSLQLCFSSWLTWPLLSFGDFPAPEVPGKRSSSQDQSGLHMGLSDSRGLVGVVADDNAAVGIFIGTSSTTRVCMGQECGINPSTGARNKCKKGGEKGGEKKEKKNKISSLASTCPSLKTLPEPRVFSAAVASTPPTDFQLIRFASPCHFSLLIQDLQVFLHKTG